MLGGPGGQMAGLGGGGPQAAMATPPPAPVTPNVGAAASQHSLFSSLMGALFDPDKTAAAMVQSGVSPDRFKQDVTTGNHLAKVMQPQRAEGAGIGGQGGLDTSYAEPATPDKFIGQNVIGDLMTKLGLGGKSMAKKAASSLPSLGELIGGIGGGQGQSQINPAQITSRPNAAQQGPNAVGQLIQPGVPSVLGRDRPASANPVQTNPQRVMPIAPEGQPDEVDPNLTLPEQIRQFIERRVFDSGLPTRQRNPTLGRSQRAEAPDQYAPDISAYAPNVDAVSAPPIQTGPQKVMPVRPAPPIIPEDVAAATTTAATEDSSTSADRFATDTGYSGGSTALGGAAGSPAGELGKNPIYNEFMGAVKTGVKNPFALAAIAATGKSESSFSSKNVYRTWNDPSASGKPGRSGGLMSWRAERYQALRNFVKKNGGDPDKPSPELQGKFLLAENPELIKKLNAAKSVEEANALMAKAWGFIGHETTKTGEGARRLALARNLVSSFGGEAGAGGSDTVAGGDGSGTTAPADDVGEPPLDLSALDDTTKKDDYHQPFPGVVAPSPGNYRPDADMKKLMLLMLMSGGGSGVVPSIGQIMAGNFGGGGGGGNG